ncbi:hypothetical protein B7463_g5092, partial [Scytalidium lignicola]
MTSPDYTVERDGNIFIITLQRAPENRLNSKVCQALIKTFNDIQKELGPGSEGAVITRSNSLKFFSTGLDLDEGDTNPFANSEGFYPLLYTILDFPFPTIACITGHTFGGACLLSLAHDYRIMNSDRGFFQMPPVNIGLHFDGMGALPKAKLAPKVARKLLLEAHKYTSKEAFEDGIVDAISPPAELFNVAMQYAQKWQGKAKADVYGVLRGELVGEALAKLKGVSYVHSRMIARRPKVKL